MNCWREHAVMRLRHAAWTLPSVGYSGPMGARLRRQNGLARLQTGPTGR